MTSFTRQFCAAVLLVCLLGCSGVGGVIGSSATADGAGDTGTSGDSGTTSGDSGTGAEALSGTESGLYEDGPVDLPVTIAKLDSVDADLITVTPTTGAAENLSSPWFVKRLEAGEAGYGVTGEVGAVNTDQATKVYGLNTTSGTSVIADVEDDGSFTFDIAASEGEVVAIAPMLDDESEIGPPVYGDTVTGVVTLATTNTSSLNADQNLLVTDDGYVYFSMVNDDLTYTLYRRNLDGTPLETVAENFPDQIRFLSINDDLVLTVITQDGKIYRVQGTATASLSARVRHVEASWGGVETVYDFGIALDEPEFFLPPTTKTFIASTGDIFVTNGNPVSADTTEIPEAVLTHIDAATGTATTLISPASDYDRAIADMGADDTLYLAVFNAISPPDPPLPFEIYRIDMTDGASAWTNRTLLYTHVWAEEGILNIDASNANMIVFVAQSPQGMYSFSNMQDQGETTTTPGVMFSGNPDLPYSEWITVSPESVQGSAKVVTCRGDGAAGSYLVIHRIGLDSVGQLMRITGSETRNACHGAYRVDDAGRILFYRTEVNDDGTEKDPQLTFINLNDVDEDQLVVDE